MKRVAFAGIAFAAVLTVMPASAATLPSGEILITQAAVQAGGITPGDTAGFPATISTSGSYRLGSNLTVTSAVNGIEVRANEVAIDLGGFTLAGSGAGRNGITSFNRNLSVRNGTVRGFTNDGIRTIMPYLTVKDMHVLSNGRYGVFAQKAAPDNVDPHHVLVADSVISENEFGVRCARFCQVSRNDVSQNEATGITISEGGGLVIANMVSYNGGYGLYVSELTGVGDNTLVYNQLGQAFSTFIPLEPNACYPACPPPP